LHCSRVATSSASSGEPSSPVTVRAIARTSKSSWVGGTPASSARTCRPPIRSRRPAKPFASSPTVVPRARSSSRSRRRLVALAAVATRRPDHDHAGLRTEQRSALVVALPVNAVFFVSEIVGGLAFHSLALMADAAHMFTDVVALAVALLAIGLTRRPSTDRHTFGLERAEVLGALVNGLALLAAGVWIVVEGIRRIGTPTDVVGGGVLAVASIGIVVNVASAVVLGRAQGR